ncbi:PREDICTED: fibroblast growth factor 22 [Elephantulus edwardii]|uniref:fibroblast growth factor 22 n=1 Tax=Elephantulus edwardii TaxID=28737 RepID=UPI0003F09018|nr:PREDICTED: fibroblast growth factor 22 [Elephantulus edwardii]
MPPTRNVFDRLLRLPEPTGTPQGARPPAAPAAPGPSQCRDSPCSPPRKTNKHARGQERVISEWTPPRYAIGHSQPLRPPGPAPGVPTGWRGRGGAGSPSGPRRPRSYPHLEGDVRWRRLFSSTHFFLCVDPGGRVQGTRWGHSPDSIVEIRSVHVGTVVIQAVHTGFYVAMNRRGRLYGSRVYTRDCRFQERIEENGYNTYAVQRWRHRGRPMFLALDGRGVPRRGGRTRRHHLSTHFLPVLVS